MSCGLGKGRTRRRAHLQRRHVFSDSFKATKPSESEGKDGERRQRSRARDLRKLRGPGATGSSDT